MSQSNSRGFLGVGFKFPLEAEKMTGRIKTVGYEEDIVEAIHLILSTRKGERIMRPEFGCGIHEHLFGTSDYTGQKLMEGEVKQALIMWEPRITDVEVHVGTREGDCVPIQISYVVRATNNPFNLVYPYFTEEGYA